MKNLAVLILLSVIFVGGDSWGWDGWIEEDMEWTQEKASLADDNQGNIDLIVSNPVFTQPIELNQKTLPRENEVKCWTCFTLDTLKVNTELCNRTLCTGKQISACYKWHVVYGFKKYRTYRGCMDNYTEIDYTNAMCRGTGLPLNETCTWDLCKTDYCNGGVFLKFSYLLLFLLLVYWNSNNEMSWPTLN